MDKVVYILCAGTSVLCAILLVRGYLRSGARLLLWSALCFGFLSINNILLFVDRVVYPNEELTIPILDMSYQTARNVVALAGLLLLVIGLIWDSER